MWNKLMVALGFRPMLSGAAHHAQTRGILVDIFEGEDGWYFSWRDEDYSRGEVKGPVPSRCDAEYLQRKWFEGLPSRAKLCIQSMGLSPIKETK